MRLFKPGLDNEERIRLEAFAKWLLDTGNGEIGESYEEDDRGTSWITIPIEYCVTLDEKGLSQLIDFIYDENMLKTPTLGSLQEKAIVCPKNDTTDAVNAKTLSSTEGLEKTYLSKDEATPMGGETSETNMLYPLEYLNTITFFGFQPHELQLKVGSPIMLLRNVNLSGGLCNGDLNMCENSIASLRIGQENFVLEARVYQKWISKSIPDMKYLSFCCILIDIQGNAIQAHMDVNNIDYFNPLLKPQMVYRISNFICEKTKPFQQTLENHISLKFGKITSFEMLIGKESEFPEHNFEFTPYNQLSSRVPYRDEDSKMIYPILTDYLGYICSISNLTPFKDATSGQKYLRKIDIENLDENIVEFTLWDDLAKQFNKDEIEKLPSPVIIVVSSCRVTRYNEIQLTASPATHYYINPRTQEAEYVHRTLKEKYNLNPPL
nr:nucleic acid-binding, OB-fold protein [Tanacetum cinerariifolium]